METSKGCRLHLQNRGGVILQRDMVAAGKQDIPRQVPWAARMIHHGANHQGKRDAPSLSNPKARRLALLEDIQQHEDNQVKFFISAKHGR